MDMQYLNVLVIDDDEQIKRLLLRIINTFGHSADYAGNCQAAIVKLSQNDFDLVLIDVNLPDGDGIELMRKARALYPELDIVAITGNLTRQEEVRIREQRVTCILIKPFSRKLILEILEHVTIRKARICNNEILSMTIKNN